MAHLVQRQISALSTTSELNERKGITKPMFLKTKAVSTHFNLNSNDTDSASGSQQKQGSRTQLKQLKANYAQSPFVKSVEYHLQNPSISIQKQQSQLVEEYSDQIHRYFKLSERTNGECLAKHGVSPSMRAKMADWMVEVLTSFSSLDQTFFVSMDLLDRYLKVKQECIPESKLHIIGVACMFIASKFSDVCPLNMETVFEHIVHKKIQPDAILAQELDILRTLNFKVVVPTSLEFLETYIVKMYKKDDENSVDIEVFKNMAVYLAKMCTYDYEFCKVKPSLLAAGSMFVASKICEQLSGRRPEESTLTESLSRESFYNESELIEISQKVLENAQNFEILFPDLGNLKKVHFGRGSEEEDELDEE